jgi:tetratricopeptide (TPR) repeat protein
MEPFTVIAAIAGAAWQGFIGNRADAIADKGFSAISKVIKRMRQSGELPPNHNLYKALKLAMLYATDYLVNGNIIPDNDFEGWSTFKKESNKWIQDEKRNIDKYISPEKDDAPAYGEVEKMLLNANDKAIKDMRYDLAQKVKCNWLKVWQTGVAMDMPKKIETLIMQGWREDDKDMDWFDITTLLFAESLKDKQNPEAKDAFQNRILAEIKTETGIISDKVEDLSVLLRASVDHYDFIKEKLIEYGIFLKIIEGKIDEGFKETDEKLDTILEYQRNEKLRLEEQIRTRELEILNLKETETRYTGRNEILNEQLSSLRNELNSLIEKNALLKEELIKKNEVLQKQLAGQGKEDNFKGEASEALKIGNIAEARRLLKLSVENEEKRIEERAKNLSQSYFELAQLDEKDLRYSEALLSYRKAVEIWPENIYYLNKYGEFITLLGQFKLGIDILEKAKLILENQTDQELLSTVLYNLSIAYLHERDYDRTLSLCKRAAEIDKKRTQPHPYLARDYYGKSRAYNRKGLHEKCKYYIEKALDIIRAVYGNGKSKEEADYLNNLGASYNDNEKDYNSAIKNYEFALSIDKRLLGEKHPSLAIRIHNIGLAWLMLGDDKKAEEYYKQGYEIDRNVLGEDARYVGLYWKNMGYIFLCRKEFQQAIECFKKAIPIVEKYHPKDHDYVIACYNGLKEAETKNQ